MPTPYETAIGSWTRRSTFFWAATGATVGLSNLWQFPYLARSHGGGAFILIYLACLLLVTLPLMLTETAIGRHSRHGIVLAMDGLIRSARQPRWWMWAGRLSILSAFLVLSFTVVIGAICLAYVFYGALGRFSPGDELGAAALLNDLVANPSDYREFMAWHGFFIVLVLWVSVQGVVGGLERALRVVVPGFLVLLVALLLFSAHHGDVPAALQHMLSFRTDDVTWASLRAALFHAFFTLGLGMGVWAIFGSYMPAIAPLKRSVVAVVLMDTLIAVMAGLVLYALVLPHAPASGEQGFALLFLALPVSLAELPGSQFVTAALFLFVVLVAWTTSLALLEPVVGWFREWTGAPRGWSVFIIGSFTWFVGLGSMFSFNIWSDRVLLGGTLFRWLEIIASGLLIPVVSILLAVFVGWILTRSLAFRLIGKAPGLLARIWYWVLRVVLPLVVAMIGVSYSYASLRNLCDNGSSGVWCQPVEVTMPGLREPFNASGEAAETRKGGPGIDTPGPLDQRRPPRRPAPDREENAPNPEQMLYHSA